MSDDDWYDGYGVDGGLGHEGLTAICVGKMGQRERGRIMFGEAE